MNRLDYERVNEAFISFIFTQFKKELLKMNGNESTLIKQDFPVSWMYRSGNVEYLSIPYMHGDICIFGLPLSEVDNEFTVTDFPKKTRTIYSLCSTKFYPYLNRMIELELNEKLEFMLIGLQHEYIDFNKSFFDDFSEISKALSKKYFPKLKVFKYGFDELYVNECRIYPNLGDITEIIEKMPALEILEINGAFELTKPLNFKYLKSLSIEVDLGIEDCNDVMAISQTTLDFIMSSKISELENFELIINNNDLKYSLNLELFKSLDLDKLNKVSISGSFQKDLEVEIYNLLSSKVKNIRINK